MQKKPKWLLFAILCLSQISCAPKPPDVPACEHLAQRLAQDLVSGHLLLTPSPTCTKEIGEPECGHCVYIVTGREMFLGEKEGHWLNGKPWSKIRQEAVYLPAVEAYAPLASYIINSCKKMHCSDDVDKFRIKLDSLNGVSAASKFLTTE